MTKNEIILSIYEDLKRLDVKNLELVHNSVRACSLVQDLMRKDINKDNKEPLKA